MTEGNKGTTSSAGLGPSTIDRLVVERVSDFARRFRLGMSSDFECLFRCWNTGRPDGKTFDPDYVPKGLRRMRLYRALLGPRSAAPASQGVTR